MNRCFKLLSNKIHVLKEKVSPFEKKLSAGSPSLFRNYIIRNNG